MDRAIAEGKLAASQGKLLSDNPYPPGSNGRAAWTLGYDSIAYPFDDL